MTQTDVSARARALPRERVRGTRPPFCRAMALSVYELERLANIADNHRRLIALGLKAVRPCRCRPRQRRGRRGRRTPCRPRPPWAAWPSRHARAQRRAAARAEHSLWWTGAQAVSCVHSLCVLCTACSQAVHRLCTAVCSVSTGNRGCDARAHSHSHRKTQLFAAILRSSRKASEPTAGEPARACSAPEGTALHLRAGDSGVRESV